MICNWIIYGVHKCDSFSSDAAERSFENHVLVPEGHMTGHAIVMGPNNRYAKLGTKDIISIHFKCFRDLWIAGGYVSKYEEIGQNFKVSTSIISNIHVLM